MDSNPSHTSASTPMVAEMHKDDQQATGDPKSLGVTSEERANPQLSSAEVDPGLSAPNDFIPQQQGIDKGTKNTSFAYISTELTNQVLILQSQNHKLELKRNKAEAEATLLRAQPSFPNIGQLNELLVKSLQTKFSKVLFAHDFNSSLPTELKELSSKFNELTEEVKGLKKQVHNLEIELLGELKEIPTKLEDFTKNITSFTSQVAKLKTLQWKLLREFLFVPTQVKAIASKKTKDDSVPSAGQASTRPAKGEKNTNHATISHSSQPEGEYIKKDKGKKALSSIEAEKESTDSDSDDDKTHVTGSMVESSIIKKVKKFNFVTEDGMHIHLTKEQINQQKKIKEKVKAEAAKHESEVRKEELVDLLGPENQESTNYDVLTRKGVITLKVYREDGTSEIIPNFKASDLHLGEWREVMNACPNRTKKGWTTIYDQIRSRMDYIHTTEAELGINLDIPLSKQDPLDKLNDITNNKRKHVDDIHDYFKANKRLKSLV
nr:hypothetical protein [Tanacetum cinerariifolium]